MSSCYRHHPAIAQHEVMQPLRAGQVGNVALQHRFHAGVAARHGIADDNEVRRGIELRGVVTLS